MSGLDIEQHDELRRYLREHGYIGPGESPAFCTLAGGVSNRTVLVERPSGESWVLKQALEQLRVPIDWYSSPDRIHREALGTRWLAELAGPDAVPEFVFEDEKHHLLAMQAVPAPHENWKRMLLAGRVETDHVAQFSRLLATIHRAAYERRDEVASVFDDRTFFESLRVEPYYRYAATQAPAAEAFLSDLIATTRRRRITLVHGDYSPKNILVHEGSLVLLDHEVIHFGDPAFDLGFSMTHLLSKAHHVVDRRTDFADAAVLHWRTYHAGVDGVSWTADLEHHAVRHTLGCLLARVAGRSRLEYFSEEERQRQRHVVLRLMAQMPATIADLATAFVRLL